MLDEIKFQCIKHLSNAVPEKAGNKSYFCYSCKWDNRFMINPSQVKALHVYEKLTVCSKHM